MKLLICCLAVASALNVDPMSRRAVLSRFAAAAPLAAVAQSASAARNSNAEGTGPGGKSAQWMSAASSNLVLGTPAGGKPGYEPEPITQAIGLDGKAVNEWGSTLPKSTTSTVKQVVTGTNVPSGTPVSTPRSLKSPRMRVCNQPFANLDVHVRAIRRETRLPLHA